MSRPRMDLTDVDEVVIDRLTAGIPVTYTGPERIAAVRQLRAHGWSYLRIADRLGTSERQVARDLARIGLVDQLVKRRRAQQAAARRALIPPLLAAGMSQGAIARTFGVSRSALVKDLARHPFPQPKQAAV